MDGKGRGGWGREGRGRYGESKGIDVLKPRDLKVVKEEEKGGREEGGGGVLQRFGWTLEFP